MAQRGFIHDKLDLKMLELYLMARVAGPVDPDVLFDLVCSHEGVDFFHFTEATAELVDSGHLVLTEEGYAITEKGRANSTACESSLPYSVRRRCTQELVAVNAALRRNALIRETKRANGDGSVTIRLTMDDETGNLLTLEMLCPTDEQADRLMASFHARPEAVYHDILESLLSGGREEE